MARQATIIGQAADHWGDLWDVRESRPTSHGWPVLLGWPQGLPRGRGGTGGPRVILTPELVGHLERHRRDTFAATRLPIGATAIKRLRRMLGHHRYRDADDWWESRLVDLATMTLEAFAEKHGCGVGTAGAMRLIHFGKRQRDDGWWRKEPARSILLAWPTAAACDKLDIAPGSLRRLRSMLNQEQQYGT